MDECLPAGLRLWKSFSKGMQIGVMIAAKRWCGKTGKFICPNEVIGIFRTRMGSDEIPSCGTFRRFLPKPECKMLLLNQYPLQTMRTDIPLDGSSAPPACLSRDEPSA